MKKLILLALLVAGAFTVTMTSTAKADHLSGCRSGWGGSYYSGYSYAPQYYAPIYRAPVYSYAPVNSFGYAYPSSGFTYATPSLSISIGSGYRGVGYGSYGGYGRGGHHHHRH